MNGGTLVNCGSLSPSSFTFYAGEINNNGTASFQSFTFGGANTIFKNYGKAEFAALSFQGGALYNYDSLVITNNLIVYTAVSHFNNSGVFVVSGDLTNYSSSVLNSGKLVIGGTYHNNYSCVLQNDGVIEIGNNYSDIGTLTNHGTVTVANNSQINGGAFFYTGPFSTFTTNTLSVIGTLSGDPNQCSTLAIETSATSNWGATVSGKINICTEGTVNFAPNTKGPDVVFNCSCFPNVPTDYLNDLSSYAVIAGNTFTASNLIIKGDIAYQSLAGNFKGVLPSARKIGPGPELNTLINKLTLTNSYYFNAAGNTITAASLTSGLSTPGIYHLYGNQALSNVSVPIGNQGRYVIVVHGDLSVTDVTLTTSNLTKNIVWVVSGNAMVSAGNFAGIISSDHNITVSPGASGNLSLFAGQNVSNNNSNVSLLSPARNLRTSSLDYTILLSFAQTGTYSPSLFQTTLNEELQGFPDYGGAQFRYKLDVSLTNLLTNGSVNALNENILYYISKNGNQRSTIVDPNCTFCNYPGSVSCQYLSTQLMTNGYPITHTLQANRSSSCDQFVLGFSITDINFDYQSSEVFYTLLIGTGSFSATPGTFMEYNFSSTQSCMSTYSGSISASSFVSYLNNNTVNLTGYDEVISSQVLTGGKTFESGKQYAFLSDVQFTNGTYTVQSGARLAFAAGQQLSDCSTPPYYTCCTFKPLGITLKNASLVSNGGIFDVVAGAPYWSGIALDNTTVVSINLSGTQLKNVDNGIAIRSGSGTPLPINMLKVAGTTFSNVRNTGINLNNYLWNNAAPIVNAANSFITGNSFTGYSGSSSSTTAIDLGFSDLSALPVSGNAINRFANGIVGYNGINATSNVLTGIAFTGIQASGNSQVRNNQVAITPNTNDPNTLLVGLFMAGDRIQCEDNTVTGTYSASGSKTYGAILNVSSGNAQSTFNKNRLTSFGAGLVLYNINGYGAAMNGNYFKAVEGIRKEYWFYDLPVAASIRCNTFDAITNVPAGTQKYGIHVAAGASMPSLGSVSEPCGNKFLNTTLGVRNESGNSSFTYYQASNENLTYLGINPSLTANVANCSGNGYANGVLRTAEETIAPSDVAAMQDTLQYQWATPERLKSLQGLIVRYYESNQDLEGLKAYADQLIHCNREAYYTFYLYLYEHAGTTGTAYTPQQLEQALLLPDPDDAEIKSRILFRHYLQNRGTSFSAEDSTALHFIASSGSGLATLAYLELRRYYPELSFQPGNYQPVHTRCSSSQRYTGEETALQALSIAPNPASGQVKIRYQAREGQRASLKIVSVSDGALVYERELNVDLSQEQVSLEDFRAGVYACTLYVDGTPAGTERLLVVKH